MSKNKKISSHTINLNVEPQSTDIHKSSLKVTETCRDAINTHLII